MKKRYKESSYDPSCKSCADLLQDQDDYLNKHCQQKYNYLPRTNCDCPDSNTQDDGSYYCECVPATLPEIKPVITVKWGDSKCDGFETNDFEVLCVSVCNNYCNVTFNDFTITHIKITDMAGNPVACLPNGTPSVHVVPSGPICFGDIEPCGADKPSCVNREFVVNTCGAVDQCYLLSFEGVCFTVSYELQFKHCFVVKLCQD